MSDETSGSRMPFTGVGGVAVLGGVACCVGVKLIGGAILFSGLATTIGLTTDQTTFVVGGVVGLLVAALVLGYRRAEFGGSPT